jgi:hypothetical protein
MSKLSLIGAAGSVHDHLKWHFPGLRGLERPPGHERGAKEEGDGAKSTMPTEQPTSGSLS